MLAVNVAPLALNTDIALR